MIVRGMTERLLGGAATAITAAAGLARHVAWYLSYQVGGNAREEDPRRGRKR